MRHLTRAVTADTNLPGTPVRIRKRDLMQLVIKLVLGFVNDIEIIVHRFEQVVFHVRKHLHQAGGSMQDPDIQYTFNRNTEGAQCSQRIGNLGRRSGIGIRQCPFDVRLAL